MSLAAAHRTTKIVDELSNIKLADLSNQKELSARLKELDSCLVEIHDFSSLLQGIVSHVPGSAAGRPRAVGADGTTPRRSGRRGPGEFSATPFILNSVKQAGTKGIRPREIVEQVQVAAPGKHVRPSALVSTILTRLKKRGEVRRRAGKWYKK